MSIETPNTPENQESALFNRIQELRKKSLTELRINELWNDRVLEFDKKLKNDCREMFEDNRPWWAIREWHILVGSTPEEQEVSDDAAEYIREQISQFVDEMEEEIERLS